MCHSGSKLPQSFRIVRGTYKACYIDIIDIAVLKISLLFFFPRERKGRREGGGEKKKRSNSHERHAGFQRGFENLKLK